MQYYHLLPVALFPTYFLNVLSLLINTAIASDTTVLLSSFYYLLRLYATFSSSHHYSLSSCCLAFCSARFYYSAFSYWAMLILFVNVVISF